MQTFFKTSLAAAAIALVAVSAIAPAYAGDRHRGYHHNDRGYSYNRGYNRGYDRGYHRGRDYDNGDALAAGLLGFGVGAVVGSAITAPPAPPPPPAYYGPVGYAAPAAWSPDWYSYCSSRYRSFNPRTGYFMGYDGRAHFCR
ncbi:BA14K family protein [Methyloligella sp. GL2]|nr:BA14K family protein [Methyloligella sp. GL2]